ncbi:hypothetical protein PWT90_07466 [Aphanocladium album]|nr:hypothetical protein PWT90_07466 [Aphanocladium album]
MCLVMATTVEITTQASTQPVCNPTEISSTVIFKDQPANAPQEAQAIPSIDKRQRRAVTPGWTKERAKIQPRHRGLFGAQQYKRPDALYSYLSLDFNLLFKRLFGANQQPPQEQEGSDTRTTVGISKGDRPTVIIGDQALFRTIQKLLKGSEALAWSGTQCTIPFSLLYHSRDELRSSDDEGIRLIVQHLTNEFARYESLHKRLCADRVVSFAVLWLIYRPGAFILMQAGELGVNERCCLQIVSSKYHEDKFTVTARGISHAKGGFEDFNYSQMISSYQGVQEIECLEILPIDYSDVKESIVTSCHIRGKRIAHLEAGTYCYVGKLIKGKFKEGNKPVLWEGRVFFDPARDWSTNIFGRGWKTWKLVDMSLEEFAILFPTIGMLACGPEQIGNVMGSFEGLSETDGAESSGPTRFCDSLQKLLRQDPIPQHVPKAVVLYGPSGCGKTYQIRELGRQRRVPRGKMPVDMRQVIQAAASPKNHTNSDPKIKRRYQRAVARATGEKPEAKHFDYERLHVLASHGGTGLNFTGHGYSKFRLSHTVQFLRFALFRSPHRARTSPIMAGRMVLYKLVVLGDGGVGKTALTIQLCLQHFVETYDPTIEDQYRKQVVIDSQPCILEVLDTAGQEEYIALRDQWIRDGEGFVLVYSIASRSSFSRIKRFYHQIQQVKEWCASSASYPGSPISAATPQLPVPIILVGNKSDRVTEREVSTQEGDALACELGCEFVEASAKDCTNVEKAFYDVVGILRRQRQQQQLSQNPDSCGSHESQPKGGKKSKDRSCIGNGGLIGSAGEIRKLRSKDGEKSNGGCSIL